eukprot:6780604-Karenia_brevis.AAC.1
MPSAERTKDCVAEKKRLKTEDCTRTGKVWRRNESTRTKPEEQLGSLRADILVKKFVPDRFRDSRR